MITDSVLAPGYGMCYIETIIPDTAFESIV